MIIKMNQIIIKMNQINNQNESNSNQNNTNDNNQNESSNNQNNSNDNQNENNPSNNDNNNRNEKDNSERKRIKRLKDSEFGLSFSLFAFSIIFCFTLACFVSKYSLIAAGSFLFLEFFCSTFPLVIYFSIDIALIAIRISCNNAYKLLIGIDSFYKLNLFLIWLNFIQLFL